MRFTRCFLPGVAQGWRKCIALKVLRNFSHFNATGQRLGLGVDLRAAKYPDFFGLLSKLQRCVQAGSRQRASLLPGRLPRDDDIGAAGQGAKTGRQ